MTQIERLAQLKKLRDPYSGFLDRVQMIKGDKGDEGKTPIKGKDYFTPQEIDQLVSVIQSRVRSGADGKRGPQGDKGTAGSTPVRGIDFWNEADREAIIRDVLGRIPKVELPTVDHQALAESAATKVLGSQKLTIEHIDGLPKTLAGLTQHLRLGGFRGGGGKVLAGSNVTVINNPDGSQTISSTSGGGNTPVYNEVLSGSGTTFTAAHTPVAGRERVYANGQRLLPTTDYTLSGATVTTVSSWSAGQISMDYEY